MESIIAYNGFDKNYENLGITSENKDNSFALKHT